MQGCKLLKEGCLSC